jgi:hypothetical protein
VRYGETERALDETFHVLVRFFTLSLSRWCRKILALNE